MTCTYERKKDFVGTNIQTELSIKFYLPTDLVAFINEYIYVEAISGHSYNIDPKIKTKKFRPMLQNTDTIQFSWHRWKILTTYLEKLGIIHITCDAAQKVVG